MKRYGRPASVVTDGLPSYRAAMTVIGNAAARTCGRWLNNRAENSHQPFRRREAAMANFRDVKTLQKFASVHASIHNHFNHETPSQPPRYFQTSPSRRLGRVASIGSLRPFDCRFYTSCPVSLTVPGESWITGYLPAFNIQNDARRCCRLLAASPSRIRDACASRETSQPTAKRRPNSRSNSLLLSGTTPHLTNSNRCKRSRASSTRPHEPSAIALSDALARSALLAHEQTILNGVGRFRPGEARQMGVRGRRRRSRIRHPKLFA